MNDLYIEWVGPSLNRVGNMLPIGALPALIKQHNPGFASVYAFSKDDAMVVRERGHSRGLSGFSVWADRVTIDIDEGDQALLECQVILTKRGLAYEVWSSGSKGYHVSIPHEPIYSPDLPYSHLSYIQGLGVPHDASLYHHARVLRLPGTIHAKTGKRKTFLYKVDGMQAQIEIKKPPAFNFKPLGGVSPFQDALLNCLNLTTNPPEAGMRHTRLWSAAKSFAESGTPYLTTLGVLLEVNRAWLKPKELNEVELAVQQAYRQAGYIST